MKEILKADVLKLLISSMAISTTVALLSTIIGTLTARAVTFYDFRLKGMVRFLNLLPLMIPAAVFAMGIHISFIRMGLSDTVMGEILIHVICGLPYSVNIMCHMTGSLGGNLEEQARLFGAKPIRAFFETSFYGLIPGFVTSFCMAYILSFSQYFITLIIGGGNVKTLATVMIPFIQGGDRTISGAYRMVFILSTLLMFGVVQWVSKKISNNKQIEIYG